MSWSYLGASVVGSGHLGTGLACQDAHIIHPVDENSLLLVVSDGAGSAEHAAEGAAIACATIVEEVARYAADGGSLHVMPPALIDTWYDSVVRRLHAQARARGVSVRELACTLAIALVTDESSHFAQVGDGAAVIGRGGVYSAVTWPENGEYVNTTFFVTDDGVLQHLQVHLNQPPVDDVALFTDGLQMLVLRFAEHAVHAPFFNRVFLPLRDTQPGRAEKLTPLLEEYLSSAEICTRTDDDKSLLLATRSGNGHTPQTA